MQIKLFLSVAVVGILVAEPAKELIDIKSLKDLEVPRKAQATKSEPKKATPKERIIKFVNNITHDAITYKEHWSGHHTPSTFHVLVNGQEIARNPKKPSRLAKKKPQIESTEVTIAGDTLDIELFYEFKVMGVTHRKDRVKYTAQVADTVEEISALFSWNADSRILFETNSKNIALAEIK